MKRTAAVLLLVCFMLGAFSACHEPDVQHVEPVSSGSPSATAAPAPEGQGPEIIEIDDKKEIGISEVMADNSGFYLRCFDDWAELCNAEDTPCSLNSFCLVEKSSGASFPLDGLTIPGRGFTVIKFTDASPFRLSKEGDTLCLTYRGEVVDELEYDASIGTSSWTHDGRTERPSPGFPNDEEGVSAYLSSVEASSLVINEAVSSNSKYPAGDGECYDFVELYNASSSPIQLSDYYLSDKRSEPQRFRLPERELEAGGYFVVWCTGAGGGEDLAPFKISSSGETLYLSDSGGFIDCMNVPGDLKADQSYGRNGGAFVYITTPTPGAQNGQGVETTVAAPAASMPTGAYDEPISVALSGEGTIYYTLDGTAPTENSRVYSEPIKVEHMASIRTFCVKDGVASGLTSYFYLVDVEHAYPIIDVAIRSDYLTGDRGVLNHIDPEYEHEAYVTMMEDGVELFSAPCGFKLHGNDSKKGAKQNFQLRFREKYGMSKLNYKVFENRDIEVFNSLLLKGGSEDYVFCNFRDELCAAIVDGVTELSTQAFRPVILYLNGEYWGFYWLRERYDTEYCAQRLGVSPDSINLLKDYGQNTVAGSAKSYSDLVQYCKTHDLRNKEDYDYVMRRVDPVSLMDWYICRSYMGDTDLANIRFYSSTEDDGRWHWCFFDLDWSFWNNTEDPIGKTARNDGNHVIILALLKNPDFKDRFLKRYASLMGSVLNEQAINAKIDSFVEIMEPEIERDREKYGYTVADWRYAVNQLRSFVEDGKRNTTVLKGIKNYFGLSDSEMISYFGRSA